MDRDTLVGGLCLLSECYKCVEADRPIGCDYCHTKLNEMMDEYDRQVKASAIDEFKQHILKDLAELSCDYFMIAKGTAMPERYVHLKRMDTVELIIEMIKLKEQK